jgi:ketosteroid isomerase-like protein
MAISEQTALQIREVLDAFRAAYAARDVEGVVAHITPGFVGYGTGADEKIAGAEEYRAQIARDFRQCEAIGMEFADLSIGAEGTVAWIAADCTVSATVGGRAHAWKGRMTGVLRGDGKTWRFAQLHLSLPAEGQRAGRSFPGS